MAHDPAQLSAKCRQQFLHVGCGPECQAQAGLDFQGEDWQALQQATAALFAKHGVAPGRLTCFSKVSHEQFWALHGEVDIALDPFPLNGGTTTCETLWLGVPLVACTGGPGSFARRLAIRMGLAHLEAIGWPETAAANETDYVRIAVQLASDPARLDALRLSLRARMGKFATGRRAALAARGGGGLSGDVAKRVRGLPGRMTRPIRAAIRALASTSSDSAGSAQTSPDLGAMALTRDFKETVVAHVQTDPAFARAPAG